MDDRFFHDSRAPASVVLWNSEGNAKRSIGRSLQQQIVVQFLVGTISVPLVHDQSPITGSIQDLLCLY
jgi:hypothetical protein